MLFRFGAAWLLWLKVETQTDSAMPLIPAFCTNHKNLEIVGQAHTHLSYTRVEEGDALMKKNNKVSAD